MIQTLLQAQLTDRQIDTQKNRQKRDGTFQRVTKLGFPVSGNGGSPTTYYRLHFETGPLADPKTAVGGICFDRKVWSTLCLIGSVQE